MARFFHILTCLTLLLWGCGEDYYPPGLYGSQVEYLLAGDDTLKIWVVSSLIVDGEKQPMESCTDSIKIIFQREGGDINAYDLRYQDGCAVYDTAFYGVLTASTDNSGNSNPNVFTDSLLFSEGEIDYLILNFIDPREAEWIKDNSEVYHLIAQ